MNRSNDFLKDGSEWELSKENVQPIKQGRKIPNLMAALTSNAGEDAHWKLQKDKKNFEAEIRTYDGEDPLDVWYRYILWTEENVPKGGREIRLLLERCIKEFKDKEQYRNDERYLQLWLKYTDCCSDPLEVFNYMYSQRICPMQSQFYIAWASACENIENYKKADEVIVLGIERNAQPIEMLKKFHEGFQHRLTAHIAAEDDPQSCESPENSRKALGLLRASGKKKNVGVMRSSSVQKAPSGNRSHVLGISNGTAPSFMVHHDPDCENKLSQLPGVLGDWKEPPTQSTVTKENESMPGKWTNDKVPAKRGGITSLVRATPKQTFQVHVEENAEQNAHVPHHSFASQVLAVRKPDSQGSDDPLKVLAQQNENGDKVKFKLMYDKAKVYTGTEEFQFEEIRAAKYAALSKQGRPLPKDIRRIKREQERSETDAEEERKKVMYPKEQVYALEGEFQPEEIMARMYYAQGRRLRPKRKESFSQVNQHRGSLKIYEDPSDISNPILVHNDVHRSRKRDTSSGSENDLAMQNNARFVKEDEKENLSQEEQENSGNYLAPGCSTVDIQREVLKDVTKKTVKTPDEFSVDNPTSRNTVYGKLFEKTPNQTKERFVSSLAGPSPTLTTKQAFAEVMPWFNTTVGLDKSPGLDDSDAEFEAYFKNDPNRESQNDLFGLAFGGKPDFGEANKETDNVLAFHDQNEENIPPVGYHQPYNDRPIVGILQPSVNVPVEPLQDYESSDEEPAGNVPRKSGYRRLDNLEGAAPSRYEEIKDHCNDEEFTQFQGLNHSQFTAAARLASTPFGEQADPRPLPTLHCSTIMPPGDGNPDEQDRLQTCTSELEGPSTDVPGSSFNTPSNILSPIPECSDEDAKTSLTGNSSHSSTASKSTVVSHHSDKRSETLAVDESSRTGNDTRLERSVDITVHSARGDVLQIVNPFDPSICRNLLSNLRTPVKACPGYHDLTNKTMPKIVAQKTVDLGDDLYKVGKLVGTGGFAKVYSAKKLSVEFNDNDEDNAAVALKVQAPANEWEFYICTELHRRVRQRGKSEQEIATLLEVDDFYSFADASCCISNYHKKGTFLDLVNYYKGNPRLSENIACYYAMEMMKIIECIHDCGIIHGDIKPDNFVLLEGNNSSDETERGLALIDFGCAIDCTLFPPGTRFTVEKGSESFECIEMKTGKAWTTQVDTYGMLGSLHCLIFGEYMKVYEDPKSFRWRTMKLVDRTWNRELWRKLFDVFLNVPSCDELPSIRNMLDEFKEYFDRKLKHRFSLHKKQQSFNLHP